MLSRRQTDTLRGSLDRLVLESLSLTPMQRWRIDEPMQQLSDGMLKVKRGAFRLVLLDVS